MKIYNKLNYSCDEINFFFNFQFIKMSDLLRYYFSVSFTAF